MKAVMSEVPPELLEERRRLGLDLFDEMWEGVLHMNPPPLGEHQRVGTKLVMVLGPIAESLGLVPFYEVGFYAAPDDYRAPDNAYARPDQQIEQGINGAELVVEIRSPHDETFEKLPWYARHGVNEVLIIHPPTRAIELYRTVDGQPDPVDPNVDGSVELKSLAGVRLSTVNTPSPRLRITAPDGTTTDV